MNQLLGRLAVVTTTLCGIVLVVTTTLAVVPALRLQVIDRAPASYRTGELIDLPPAVYEGRPITIVIFARASCEASRRSSSHIRALVRQLASSQDARVVLLSGSDAASQETDRAFVGELGLSNAHDTADFRTLRLKRVPAVAVLGGDGRIRSFHEGELTADTTAAITASLRLTPAAGRAAE